MEHRQFIEPKDVLTIQFECGKCGAKISFPLSGKPEPLIECRVCDHGWITEKSQEHDALRQFVEGLTRIVPAMRGRDFKLVMEVPSDHDQGMAR